MVYEIPTRSFESERCYYRPWEIKDAEKLFQMYSNPLVYQFLGTTPKPVESVEKAKLGIERWASKIEGFAGIWAMVEKSNESDTPFGTILLVPLSRSDDEETSEYEIGWHLDPSMHGKGYATEGGMTMIKRAKENGLSEVHAVVYPANVKSLEVCHRLGMSELGLTSIWYKQTLIEFVLELGE